MAEEYDAGNKKDIGNKKAKQQLATEAEVNRLRYMMQNIKGRAFMYGLLEDTHMYQTSFDPRSTHNTAFREGERNIGLRYFVKIQTHFQKEYAQMLEEHGEK